jgi:Domain of unknown function (DUF6542)
MSTPPGWEPRPGPTRGDPARRAPRGSADWARDDGDSRRQAGRGGAPAAGRGWESGPSFTPGRAPGSRDSGPGGRTPRDNGSAPRAPRGDQGRSFPDSDGYDRRSPVADDFTGRPRSSGEGRTLDRDRSAGGPPNGLDGLPSAGITRWLGRMSTRTALLVLVAGSLLGVIGTLVAGQEPGVLLGAFIIVGTIAAALGIRPGKVYLLFPAPALAFFVAAVVTGKVHDAKLGSSTAGLGAGFTQWVAGIFFPAVVATILVLLLGGGRWLLDRQLVTGQSLLAAGPSAPDNMRQSSGSRRPAVDDWTDDNPFDSPRFTRSGPTPRQGTGPTPRPGTGPTPGPGTGPAPRQGTGPTPRPGTGPAPRQGTGPTPRQGTGATPRQGTGPTPRPGTPSWQGGPDDSGPRPVQPPRDRSQPTGPRPRPDGQPQPRTPRPSWNPAPTPQHPRRQPPDGWDQR